MGAIGRRAALAGGLSMLGARPGRAETGPVRIGVLTDETGPYADSGGAGSVLAARMAAADFGGVALGRPVEVLHADTGNKPDVAGAIARQWYDSDGVDLIIDLPVTAVAAAVQQVAREKQRSLIITAAATTSLTAKTCGPTSVHWADNTDALSAAAAGQIVASGGRSWFFITVDYSFGTALQQQATAVIAAQGGTVLGSARFAIGTADFSSMLLQARASGAQVIGLASVGHDLENLVKQAGEFGLARDRRLAGFLVFITDIHALGLKATQGFTFASSFYWDQSEAARVWSRRFHAARKAMPTRTQSGVYAGTFQYLRAMQAAGTRDALAVNAALRDLDIDYFGRPARVRPDGRVLYDIGIYRVKALGESRYPWDYYEPVGTLPRAAAFAPPGPGCDR